LTAKIQFSTHISFSSFHVIFDFEFFKIPIITNFAALKKLNMIEIIPAIDLIDGKCVRLSQGDYNQKTIYNENPLEVAKMFEDAGIRRLHLVDLDGAKANHIVNHRVLERIANSTDLIIDFGGGLKSDDDLRIAFESGAAMVTGGSIAVKSPEIFASWIQKYGSEKIILGADVKEENIAVTGWTETTSLELLPFIASYSNMGINKVICTDISKDGMLQGTSVALYEKILSAFPDLFLIASGGVGSVQDILLLQEKAVPAVITGKALYEGRISLKELSAFLA
jgi:phosphoribosylformimino-5-aminoimidazole carboxamide ribotide isomerase